MAVPHPYLHIDKENTQREKLPESKAAPHEEAIFADTLWESVQPEFMELIRKKGAAFIKRGRKSERNKNCKGRQNQNSPKFMPALPEEMRSTGT